MTSEEKCGEQQSPEPSATSQATSPPQQAMTSTVPAGGPDDAPPSSEMAGLEVKDGALPRTEDEVPSMDLAAEGADSQQSRPANYKTRLCMKWQQHGECSFGNRCNFAHGSDELRPSAAPSAPSTTASTSSNKENITASSSSSSGSKSEQQNHSQQHQHHSLQQQPQRESGPRGGRSGSDRSSGSPWNRKTRLCTKWVNTGSCPYGDRCNFAHGQQELKRPHPNERWAAEEAMVQQMGGMGNMVAMGMMQGMPQMPMMAAAQGNPKSSNYKTRICLNWHKTGQCQYAARCNFAHGHMELRVHGSMDKAGFGRGMHGHSHHYHQMGHAHGNGQIAHMQQQMGGPGVQGMQGMQAFNNMMMNQMPMLGMPAGMPEMPPHMMGNMAGAMMGMPMMMDMEQLKQQMGQMNIDPQMNPMAGMPGQATRARPGQPNMMGGQPAHGGLMMAGMPNGMPMAPADAMAPKEPPSESPTQAALPQQTVS